MPGHGHWRRWSLFAGVLALLIVVWLLLPWSVQPKLPPGVTPADYKLARRAFELRYHKPADHFDVISWLAESAVANNRLDRATACFRAIPSEHPQYGHSARLQQGQVLLRLKKAAEAEAQFREFLRIERQSPQLTLKEKVHALHQLRHILEVELRFEDRVPVLEELEQLGACDPFSISVLCFPSVARWNGPAASAWLEEFWHATPADFEIRVALARYRTAQGQLAEAKQIIDACLKERPQSLTAMSAALAWFSEQGDWDGLTTFAQRLPPLATDEPWLLLRLRAQLALREQKAQEALVITQTLLRRNPTDIEGWEILAEAQARLGLMDDERESRHKANLLARIQTRGGGIVFHNDDPAAQEQVVALLLEVADLTRQAGFDRETRYLAKFLLELRPGLSQAEQFLATTARPPQTNTAHDTSSQPATVRPRPSSTGTRPRSPVSSDQNVSFQFQDIAAAAGVQFERFDDVSRGHRIQESTGGGVALFDYDGDGLLDIYFSNGCRLPRKLQDQDHPPAFYRNQGQDRWELVTLAANLTWFAYGGGCTVGDVDADGFPDLFVTAFGATSLWRNNGDGTFRDATEESGIRSDAWNTSAAFADVNRDGHLDLYVATYVHTSHDPPELCPEKNAPDGYSQCPPTLFPAEVDVLFLSAGDGTYFRAPPESRLQAPDGKGLGVVVFHADADDWPDIYVANDGTPNFLFLNRTSLPSAESDRSSSEAAPNIVIPRFEESATALGCAVNRHGAAEASMGVACGDYDADGWLDLFCTNFHLETNTLYRNLEGAGFSDETARSRLGPPSRPMLGFGTQFFDADNNGWLDLIVTNGHIDDLRWKIGANPYRMRPQLFRNDGDQGFSDVSASSGEFFRGEYLGRGLAIGDLDNDGDLDVVISHQLGPSAVVRNDTNSEHKSVTLRLVGTGSSNRSAINAIVETEGLDLKLVREVIGGGSFQSASDLRVHLGLGQKSQIPKLLVRWPSGQREEFQAVAAGNWTVVEGRGLFATSQQ